MGRGMQETNERSRQESGNVGSIVPSPARFCKGREGGCYKLIGKGRQDGVRKVSPDGRTDRRLDLQRQSPAFWHWALQVQRPAASSSPPHTHPPAGRMEVKGSEMETTKDSLRHFSLPSPPPLFYFLSPLHSPLNFPSPSFPPLPLPLVPSRVYRGGAQPSFLV